MSVSRSSRRGRALRRRPTFEQLEGRSLLAAVITVNSQGDFDERDTEITLREAILINNRTLSIDALTVDELAQVAGLPTDQDADTIAFNVPPNLILSSHGGPTISPLSPLPSITDPVTIDGYTQPGSSKNSLTVGNDAILLVELNGSAISSSANGLFITDGGSGSTVQGLVINGFPDAAIRVIGDGNVIRGNFLGTDPAGTAALPNDHGVFLTSGFGSSDGAANNIIGGDTPDARNIISGNDVAGIEIGDAGTTGNQVLGNYIGVNAAGTGRLGNAFVGIRIGEGASGNTIGGSRSGGGNVISANDLAGVFITTIAAGNVVQGNLIGTDATGTVDLGNNVDGVAIALGAQGNLVGGTTAVARNIISGNGASGVNLVDQATSDNFVRGNFIGTDVTGTRDLGNAAAGVTIQAGASGNMIGGTIIGAGNTIAFNAGIGVNVSSGRFNAVLGNSIFSNGEVGIDLGGDGVSVNDVGDADIGANNLQNFPVLTAVTPTGQTTTIQGTLNSLPRSQYRIEFFASTSADPSGFGEGQTLLGSINVQTDDLGNAPFTFSGPTPSGTVFTATVTQLDIEIGPVETSEFSAAFVLQTCSFVVTNVLESGPGSLGDAIICANNKPGTDTISFNIQGSGVHAIAPKSALPTITDPVIIDGYTQPGAKPNSDPTGFNGTLLIELNGIGTSSTPGLRITAGNSTVRGLAIGGFAGNGIVLQGGGGSVVEGTFIGTDATGSVSRSNGLDGVLVSSSGNRIGGSSPGSRNVISGNLGAGVVLSAASNNSIQGNLIGTDRTGAKPLGNRAAAVAVGSESSNNAITSNVIAASLQGFGVAIFLGANGNAVQGNSIGTDVTGTIALGNLTGGVFIDSSSNNVIGGLAAGAGNRIAFSGQPESLASGVLIVGSGRNNAVLGNSIYSNTGLGIDLGGDGVTLNDPGDADTGANNLQNVPDMSAARINGNQLAITYRVPSDPANATYPLRVEFFRADTDGQEGQTLIGFDSFTATDFAAGTKTITFTPTAAISAGNRLVATATDAGGNTSEFSPGVTAAIDSADTPSVTNANTVEDTQTTSGLVISRNPSDGPEVTHFQITGITNGTLFQNDGVTPINNGDFITFAQGNAGLRFTPTPNFFGTASFNVQASLSNTAAGLGGGIVTATITVAPMADTPTVTNATTTENTQTTSGLVITRNPADGPEVTHFRITNIVGGTLYQNDGVTPIPSGSFITVAQGNAGLKFTPAPGFTGTGSFNVQASRGNNSEGTEGGVATATITVLPAGRGTDFGDAPASYGTVSHGIGSGLILGKVVDAEPNGQPNASASGDDTGGSDDEDGVSLPSTLVPGLSAAATVTASAPGRLDAWIDFNRNGVFDTGEQIAASLPVVAGANRITFAVPAGAPTGTTYARFRLSAAGGLAPTGDAADGEVEDYSVSLVRLRPDSAVLIDDPLNPGKKILVVTGTPKRDDIRIQLGPNRTILCRRGCKISVYPSAAVSRIVVMDVDANDRVRVDPRIKVPVEIQRRRRA